MIKKIGFMLAGLLLSASMAACSESETVTEETVQTTTEQNDLGTDKSKEPVKDETKTDDTSIPEKNHKGELKVYYLDVGQGDSIYIKTPNGDDILIDGGNNDKGDEVVSYLREYNVDDLEVMVATHPDADHIGGLDVVLDEMKVESVYMPKITHTTKTFEDFIVAVKNEGLKLKEAKAGVDIGLDGVTASFLAPVKSYGDDLNTSSAVLKMEHGENSFLFTGDATIESEQDMVAAGEQVEADVLKLGHHGADTSTSEAFLSRVDPQYAVISVGEGNSYGHPTETILTRMKNHGITVKRTDKEGTILATSDGKTIKFTDEPSLIHKSASRSSTKKSVAPVTPKTETTHSSDSHAGLNVTLSDKTPDQYETIELSVTGGTSRETYTAVFHYKSKDTTYEGKVGEPLPVKISRAAAGFEVMVDITTQSGQKTQTSFIPQ